MKLTFLGTGTSQGIPIIACNCAVCNSQDKYDKRLRASALIEVNDVNIVIDAGPDFRQQMLNANLKKLDAILLTHEHRDHIAGLDDIRPFNFLQQKPMDIWAEKRVIKAIETSYDYVFSDDKYPGSPEMNLHEIDGRPFKVGKVEIIPIRIQHLKMPIYGFRILNLTYITDASHIANDEKEKIRGTEYLIINALRIKKHYSHFNLDEALAFIDEIKPKQAYITHIGDQMGFHAKVQGQLPENVFLAFDGLVVECC